MSWTGTMPSSPNHVEFRHLRTSSLHSLHSNGTMNPMPGASRFDGPRSPPNTSHVPCKFFRQGACQAGSACPFSHDIGSATENVCKYFAKGNCKFGPKCANVHVLPDGRRVNYHKGSFSIGGATPIPLGSRVNPTTYHQTSSSALTNSFMRAGSGGGGATSPFATPPSAITPTATSGAAGGYPGPGEDGRYGHHLGRQPSLENGLPTIDTTYSSNPASAYGSPRDEDTINRFGLGLSPAAKGLSVLDAPLPASFDSNGISHAARYGPWPSSVPSKFGLESPSPSLNAAKDGRTSETLKLLHTSAFGSSDHLSPSALPGIEGGGALGSSPPVQLPAPASVGNISLGLGMGLGAVGAGGTPISNGAGGGGAEEYFGKQPAVRPMHSASLRYAKPRMMSSSAPKFERDWEPEFLFEEDYVPDALANEVLTPAEKARRSSLRLMDGAGSAGSGGGSSSGLDGVGGGIAATNIAAMPGGSTKYGSPGLAVSPSRWGPLFQRQRDEEADNAAMSGLGVGSLSSGKAMKHAAGSAFGHVGSPLRQSSLAIGDDISANGESTSSPNPPVRPPLGPMTSGGNRSESGTGSGSAGVGANESLSVLTQQLQRTRFGDESSGSPSPHLHPYAARNPPAGTIGTTAAGIIGKERDRERHLERHISSGSVGSSAAGRFTTPIDEEDSAFVFSMEEEDDALSRARKRVSGGGLGSLGATWSYAGVAAGKGSVSSAGNLAGSKARDGSGNAVMDGVAGR